MYSEAVVAVNRKQTDEALKVLDELLERAPNYKDALELRALLYKNQGDDGKALLAYRDLIRSRPGLKESAPYHFETGMIYYRQKKEALAKPHLESSLRARFNATVCRFFLGMISFNEKNSKHAEYYFRRVTREGGGELKLISHYYLGLIQLKTSYPLGATRDFKAARRVAAELPPDNTTAQQITSSVDQILVPFSRPQWIGNVSFLGQYDSNVAQIPTSLAAGDASGKSTPKLSLLGSVGRMSAPVDTVQYVATYRLSLNKNLSSDTRGYEFFSNNASVFLNYDPLAPTQFGMKLEGSFVFQNQQSDSDPNSYVYHPYNLSGELGPYVRHQATRQLQLELNLYFRPQKYYGDDVGESGNSIFTRVSAKGDFFKPFFNPSGSVSFENNSTQSADYRARTLGIGASNLMKITPSDQATLSADFLSTGYFDHSLGRSDKNLTLRVGYARILSPKMSLLGDASYTKNISTIADSYSYDRLIVGAGLSYSL